MANEGIKICQQYDVMLDEVSWKYVEGQKYCR